MNTLNKARFPHSLTDAEFVSLFRIEELPECGEGLWLLKQWIESDPSILGQLQDTGSLPLESLDVEQDPIFRKWFLHTQGCPDCQRRQGSPA